MSSGIIEDIELIKYTKKFNKQFLKAFPWVSAVDSPNIGHIISVYTKGGVGISGSGKPLPGTLSTSIDVFSPKKEFYAPKYDKSVPADNQESNLRTLVHWLPSVYANETGGATANFYNGDLTGDYVIIVEAISADCRIGFREKVYSVRDKNFRKNCDEKSTLSSLWFK